MHQWLCYIIHYICIQCILYIDIDWYELGNASSFSINSTIPFSNYLVMAFFSILVYSSFSVIYQLLCNIQPPWVLGSFPSPFSAIRTRTTHSYFKNKILPSRSSRMEKNGSMELISSHYFPVPSPAIPVP